MKPPEMEPTQMTAVARALLTSSDRRLGTTRLLAASLLLRQALEDSLDAFWAHTLSGMQSMSGRAQLVSLPFYLSAPDLAGDVTYAWYRLSATCHHDAYELPPPPEELINLADIVDRLVQATI
jgi:hypothetical protein